MALTFTGGGGGHLRCLRRHGKSAGGLSRSVLRMALPGHAGNSGCAANCCGTLPGSDTAGTFYNDRYTPEDSRRCRISDGAGSPACLPATCLPSRLDSDLRK